MMMMNMDPHRVEKATLDFDVDMLSFLAMLVALHFTPVSQSVGHWTEFRTGVAWSLRACSCRTNIDSISIILMPLMLQLRTIKKGRLL